MLSNEKDNITNTVCFTIQHAQYADVRQITVDMLLHSSKQSMYPSSDQILIGFLIIFNSLL